MGSVFSETHCGGSCGDKAVSSFYLDEFSQSNIGAVFDVSPQLPDAQVISAFNLQPGFKVLVEMVAGVGSSQIVGPLMCAGKQLELTSGCNQLALKMPGRYRLRVVDAAGANVTPGPDMPTVDVLASLAF